MHDAWRCRSGRRGNKRENEPPLLGFDGIIDSIIMLIILTDAVGNGASMHRAA